MQRRRKRRSQKGLYMNKNGTVKFSALVLAAIMALNGHAVLNRGTRGVAIAETPTITAGIDNNANSFSLFNEDAVNTFKRLAQEGKIITLPGSDDTYTFVSKTEDAVTWNIGEKGISITIGPVMDEYGKTSEYGTMYHTDSKKGIIRSLKQITSEDGNTVYLISKTEKKKTTEYPLTSEQFIRAEQGFKDPKSFDAAFDAIGKAIERDNKIYMFTQETFDYLDAQKGVAVVNFPGTRDKFTSFIRYSDARDWLFNDKGLQIVYLFETNETGKEVLITQLYHAINEKGTLFVNLFEIDYQGEGEPVYSIRKQNAWMPMGSENREVFVELTVDEFASAVERFIKDPKKFNAIFSDAQKRKSSVDGSKASTSSIKTGEILFDNPDGTQTSLRQLTVGEFVLSSLRIVPNNTQTVASNTNSEQQLAPWQGNKQTRGAYSRIGKSKL